MILARVATGDADGEVDNVEEQLNDGDDNLGVLVDGAVALIEGHHVQEVGRQVALFETLPVLPRSSRRQATAACPANLI